MANEKQEPKQELKLVSDAEMKEFGIHEPFSRTLSLHMEEWQKLKDNAQPCPPYGYAVGWIPHLVTPREREIEVAVVTDILDPGVLKLHVLSNAIRTDMNGAAFISHPRLQRKNVNPGPAGVWFYLQVLDDPNFVPPKTHYDKHNTMVRERRRGILQAEAKRQEEARQGEEQERQETAMKMQQPAGSV